MFPLLLAAGDGHVPGAGVDRVLDELGHGLEGLTLGRAMIVMAFRSSPILEAAGIALPLFSFEGFDARHYPARIAMRRYYIIGSSWNRVGDLWPFHRTGSMQVSILSRRYSSSRNPYARRWMTRILLFKPSTKPRETLFSGLQ